MIIHGKDTHNLKKMRNFATKLILKQIKLCKVTPNSAFTARTMRPYTI